MAQPQPRRPARRLRPTNAITLIAEPTKEYQAHRLGEADQERLGQSRVELLDEPAHRVYRIKSGEDANPSNAVAILPWPLGATTRRSTT